MTLKMIGAGLALAVALSTGAQARLAEFQSDRHGVSDYTAPSARYRARTAHRHAKLHPVSKITFRAVLVITKRPTHHRAGSRDLRNITPVLAVKIREILGACQTKVVSGYRPSATIAGSGHASLHSRFPAEAVDVAGDPRCIYARLKHWKGGYSVDYAAVRHVHISFAHDRKEHGARFTHHQSYRHHYARAW